MTAAAGPGGGEAPLPPVPFGISLRQQQQPRQPLSRQQEPPEQQQQPQSPAQHPGPSALAGGAATSGVAAAADGGQRRWPPCGSAGPGPTRAEGEEQWPPMPAFGERRTLGGQSPGSATTTAECASSLQADGSGPALLSHLPVRLRFGPTSGAALGAVASAPPPPRVPDPIAADVAATLAEMCEAEAAGTVPVLATSDVLGHAVGARGRWSALRALYNVARAAEVAATEEGALDVERWQSERADFLSDFPLPSLGSMAHAYGTCQACHFANKPQGCHNGKACGLCHYSHGRRRARKARGVEDHVMTPGTYDIGGKAASRGRDSPPFGER